MTSNNPVSTSPLNNPPFDNPPLNNQSIHNPLEELLAAQDVAVLDGALATELEKRGADLQDALWSAKLLLEAPEMIQQLHFDYFAAGADIAITASYQASFEGFAQRGLDQARSVQLMRQSVALAKAARDEFWADPANRIGRQRPLVAASIGPYGAFLADGSEYSGGYGLSVEALKAWHLPRMAALAGAQPDLLACETIPELTEAQALVELLAEFELPGWLSFSCQDGAQISSGEPFMDGIALADSAEAIVATGVNCTPPRFVADLLTQAKQVTSKPLLCYPNSGETWDAVEKCWLPGTGVTDFAEPARLWRAAGARLIGGCCRTGPGDVGVIREALGVSGLTRDS